MFDCHYKPFSPGTLPEATVRAGCRTRSYRLVGNRPEWPAHRRRYDNITGSSLPSARVPRSTTGRRRLPGPVQGRSRGPTPSPTCAPTWAGAPTAGSIRSPRRGRTIELYVRWMQEVRRLKPSTVSRRMSIVAGFYRTAVIDGLLEHSPAEHVRRPTVPADSPDPRADPPATRSPADRRPAVAQPVRLRRSSACWVCSACGSSKPPA